MVGAWTTAPTTIRPYRMAGATIYSVSHWTKFYTHYWYTASRACKFKQVDSAECKCCSDGVVEITAHIFQCTNRNKVHLEHHQKLTALLADQQLPNGPLHIIEAGIDLALLSNNTHQGETWDGDDDGNIYEKRVAQLMNADDTNIEYKEAFRQQTIIGWEYIFTGKFSEGWRDCWTELGQWPMKFAISMMTWGRACWSSRNSTLFGDKTNSYAIQRKRLLVEAKVWRKAMMMERLVGDANIQLKKKTLKTAASITIATWLDEIHDLRRKIKAGKQRV